MVVCPYRAKAAGAANLLVRRQRLHCLRVYRDLHFVAERRRHQGDPESRERIHEREIAETPNSEISQRDSDLPDAERNPRDRTGELLPVQYYRTREPSSCDVNGFGG